MAARSHGAQRRPALPAVGSIVTGIVVDQAKRGVLVELGATEVLLPRTRYGAAADLIEGAGYGDALTVEVIADPGSRSGVGVSRIGIERSLRQPRLIVGVLQRRGVTLEFEAADGSAPFAVVVLDRPDVEEITGSSRTWSVGAPYRDLRLLLGDVP